MQLAWHEAHICRSLHSHHYISSSVPLWQILTGVVGRENGVVGVACGVCACSIPFLLWCFLVPATAVAEPADPSSKTTLHQASNKCPFICPCSVPPIAVHLVPLVKTGPQPKQQQPQQHKYSVLCLHHQLHQQHSQPHFYSLLY